MTLTEQSNPASGVHAALSIDRVVHEPARLAILAVLVNLEEADFAFLLAATGLTKGNLSRQTTKLEEAGYIRIHKHFRGRVPATHYRITEIGRRAFHGYWVDMAAIRARTEDGEAVSP